MLAEGGGEVRVPGEAEQGHSVLGGEPMRANQSTVRQRSGRLN